MATKVNSIRRTLFPNDSDDIAAAKSTNSAYDKFTAIRWLTPNTIIVIVSATLLTIYGNEILRTGLIYLYERAILISGIMLEWLQYTSCYDLAQMLIISAMVTIFTMAITYYDSDVPGTYPPTPFSPRKAKGIQYAVHKEKSHKLNYLTAIASGVATFMVLFVSKANV